MRSGLNAKTPRHNAADPHPNSHHEGHEHEEEPCRRLLWNKDFFTIAKVKTRNGPPCQWGWIDPNLA